MKRGQLSRLFRWLLVLVGLGAAAVLGWQTFGLLAREGQALAPIVGQYYVGESWMVTATPTPLPTATPRPTLPATPAARPVAVSPLPPVPTPDPVEPTSTPLRSMPEAYLVEVAGSHGIDPAGTYVIVNQNTQRLTVVEDGAVLRAVAISSGDPDQGWYTPAWSGHIGEFWGTFSANGVWADDAWYLFQAGGSILIHSLPYTLDEDGTKDYQGGGDLGVFPASRGCIRMDPEEASWFTEWGPQGVPIVILPWNSGTGRRG